LEEVVGLPNIKSAKKRVEVTKVKSAQNQAAKSVLKTSIRKAEASIAEGDPKLADSTYKSVVKTIDQAVAKGILHKNTAARRKSKLAKSISSIAK
jgi:small subunit ribosomal protein S20